MKIRRILLQNYRAIESLEFNLHPRLTVIVGENGCGKTSVTHALRLLLWSYIRNNKGHIRQGTPPRIQVSDVHRHYRASTEDALGYPCVVKGEIFFPEEGNFEDFDAQESLNDELSFYNLTGCALEAQNKKPRWIKGSATDIEATSKVLDTLLEDYDRLEGNETQANELPAVACYGTNRLWKKSTSLKNIDRATFRFVGYDGAASLNSNLLRFEWFLLFLFSAANNGYLKKTDITELWLGVKEAIHSVTGWEQALPEKGGKYFFFKQSNTPNLQLSQLGDGVRGMIELVGDLACRCAILNPYYGKDAVKETSGVVLIDEVDLHLHPRWQQKILSQLQEAFPKIQFIVTTHSPQVLSTVPAECIRVLKTEPDEETGQPRIVIKLVSQQTQGAASADVLAAVMDIDPVPDIKPANQLSGYMALIQQDQESSAEGIRLRTDLEAHFGADHPLMLECQRLIRLQALKRKLPPRGLREQKE